MGQEANLGQILLIQEDLMQHEEALITCKEILKLYKEENDLEAQARCFGRMGTEAC